MKQSGVRGWAVLGVLLLLATVGTGQDRSAGRQAKSDAENPELEKLIAREEKPAIDIVAGATVYKMPLIGKINVHDVKLFPHYKPQRAAAGWQHAYLEPASPTLCTMLVEEIPPHSMKLIGRKDTGSYAFIAITGKGYTEFRADATKPGKGIVWSSKDYFYMPFGSWFGHANPFDEPARLLTSVCHLAKDDILNPMLGRTRTVPEFMFPGERRDRVAEDDVVENVDWTAIKSAKLSGSGKMDIVKRGPDRKSTRLNSSHIQKSRMPSSA